MRIAADGYVDLGDYRVRTPGRHHERHDPMPLGEGLAFLFSHTLPGHRLVTRAPTDPELSYLQHAVWADGVAERMDLVDRVWRAITQEATTMATSRNARLVQVIRTERDWIYPLHHDNDSTIVLPEGGDPLDAFRVPAGVQVLHLTEAHGPLLAATVG